MSFFRTKSFVSFLLSHLAVISFVCNPILFSSAAYAAPVSHHSDDAPLPIKVDGSTNTQVTKTASGVDQINIAAPNSAGISHNNFVNYNVNRDGQILNNFSGKVASEVAAGSNVGANAVTNTEIGGFVTVNPNLYNSGREARTIINEVTSANNSQLLGYLEVAGGKADVIIANQNGIICNGCGFINTARLSIIAGTSNVDPNGNISFDLGQQSVAIGAIPVVTIAGLGLDATRVTSADIISRSVNLAAVIYGGKNPTTSILTGNGTYDYTNRTISSNSSTANQPLFAIDANSLGSIQSGRIFLIATEAGLGVRLSGNNLIADEQIGIDAAGNLYYSNLQAPSIDIRGSADIIQSVDSDVLADDFSLTALGNFSNYGNIQTYNDIDFLTADFTNYGNIFSTHDLNLTAADFINSGEIISNNNLTLRANFLTNSNVITAAKDLELTSSNLNNSGEISALNNLTLAVANLAVNSGNLITNKTLTITGGTLENSGLIQASNGATFNLVTLINSTDSLIYSAKNLSFNVSDLLNNSGDIFANIDLVLTANSLTNYGGIFSNNDLTISTNSLTNSGSINSLDARLTAVDFVNSGEISSSGDLIISATALDNSGLIFANILALDYSGVGLQLVADSFSNSGILASNDALRLTTVDLTNAGEISAVGNLSITNSNNFTNSNLILANGDVNISSKNLNNLGADESVATIASLAQSLTLNF